MIVVLREYYHEKVAAVEASLRKCPRITPYFRSKIPGETHQNAQSYFWTRPYYGPRYGERWSRHLNEQKFRLNSAIDA